MRFVLVLPTKQRIVGVALSLYPEPREGIYFILKEEKKRLDLRTMTAVRAYQQAHTFLITGQSALQALEADRTINLP